MIHPLVSLSTSVAFVGIVLPPSLETLNARSSQEQLEALLRIKEIPLVAISMCSVLFWNSRSTENVIAGWIRPCWMKRKSLRHSWCSSHRLLSGSSLDLAAKVQCLLGGLSLIEATENIKYYVCIYIYTYIYIHMYMYIYICIYIYTCMYACVCMCVCVPCALIFVPLFWIFEWSSTARTYVFLYIYI